MARESTSCSYRRVTSLRSKPVVMVSTNEMELAVSKGTRYWDCFKGTDLRRTEIVAMTWISQTMAGNVVGGLSAYFYTRAGISTSSAYKLGWGQSGIGAAGTIGSWFVLNRVGRKTLMLGGMIVMFWLLMFVLLSISSESDSGLASPDAWVSLIIPPSPNPGQREQWSSSSQQQATSPSVQ